MIENAPTTWQDLQTRVAAILKECGMIVEVEREIATPREKVNVDVFADDPTQSPHAVYLCECKHWRNPVPKTVVHAFRSVVTDFGANYGLIISSAGFQSGAFEAAGNTNIRLLDWAGFDQLFEARWWKTFALKKLKAEVDRLVSFTDILNARVARYFQTATPSQARTLDDLRKKYNNLAFFALHQWIAPMMGDTEMLRVPIELKDNNELADPIPADVVAATTRRELVDRICNHAHEAIPQFNEILRGHS